MPSPNQQIRCTETAKFTLNRKNSLNYGEKSKILSKILQNKAKKLMKTFGSRFVLGPKIAQFWSIFSHFRVKLKFFRLNLMDFSWLQVESWSREGGNVGKRGKTHFVLLENSCSAASNSISPLRHS